MALVLARAISIPVIRRTLRHIVYSHHFLKCQQKQVGEKESLPKIQTRFYAEEREHIGEKPHCNIGTIGHANHGKSTLTAAITKILSKNGLATSKSYNAAEENSVGIKINVTQVEYETDNRHYTHTDYPKNVDYIKNMIIGTEQIDGAILVVAANEGIMSQTRKHLILSKQIGVEHIIVFINKVDVANIEGIKFVEMEIRKLLSEMGFNSNKTPIVKGSALCALKGKNNEIGYRAIIKLLSELDNFIPTPVRDLDKPFLMPVEGAYSSSGHDTVVIGKLKRGIIKKGMTCEFVGINKTFTSVITGFNMFPTTLNEAHAGDQVGVLISGVKKDQVRGMVMCEPGSITTHDHIEAQVYIHTSEEGGKNRALSNFIRLQMFCKSWDCCVEINIPKEQLAMPGEDVTMQLKLLRPMVLEKGERFTLRDASTTLGTGVISSVLKNLNKQQRSNLLEIKENDKKKGENSSFWKKIFSELNRSKRFWWEVLGLIVTGTFGWLCYKIKLSQHEKKLPKEIDQLDLLNTKLRKELNEKDEERMRELKEKLIKVLDLIIIYMEKK
ncbi:elongation factor Tu-like [Aphidius gifuensis]|uniref:elongation factor Tu-like n=1 Tax=Aphidius gifuensis TaxID=684658 RepID=UPI001CDD3542|nr:elongation factor Tu-like [Aphidius gifuensis]